MSKKTVLIDVQIVHEQKHCLALSVRTPYWSIVWNAVLNSDSTTVQPSPAQDIVYDINRVCFSVLLLSSADIFQPFNFQELLEDKLLQDFGD